MLRDFLNDKLSFMNDGRDALAKKVNPIRDKVNKATKTYVTRANKIGNDLNKKIRKNL